MPIEGGSDGTLATQAKPATQLNSTHTSALPVRPHFPQDIDFKRFKGTNTIVTETFLWERQILWESLWVAN